MIGDKRMLIQRRSKRKPRKNVGSISAQYSPSGINASRVINLYVENIIKKMISRLKTHKSVLGIRSRNSIEGKGFQTKPTAKKANFAVNEVNYSPEGETSSLTFAPCIATCYRFPYGNASMNGINGSF